MAEEEQAAEEGGKDVWWNAVKRFPDGVRDGVRPWSGGWRTLCQGDGDLIGGESSAVCTVAEDGVEGSRRLRRKKIVDQASLIWVGVVASGREGKRGASLPRDSFFTVHIVRGVAEARRDL